METVISTLVIAAIWSFGYVLGCYFTIKETTRTIRELGDKWLKVQENLASDNSKPF